MKVLKILRLQTDGESIEQINPYPMCSSPPTSATVRNKFRPLAARLASFLNVLFDVVNTDMAKRFGIAVALGILSYQCYKIVTTYFTVQPDYLSSYMQVQSAHNKRLNSSALAEREFAVARRERELEIRRNETQADSNIATHEHLAHVLLKAAVQHADTALDLKKEKKKKMEAEEMQSSMVENNLDLDATLQ